MTTHPYWEILGQLLENHLLSLGSAWQWFPPWKECYLIDGEQGKERGGKNKRWGEKRESLFFHGTVNLSAAGRALVKLPASLPVRNSMWVWMPSKRSIKNRFFFNMSVSLCLIPQTWGQLYSSLHWSILKTKMYVFVAPSQCTSVLTVLQTS